jgi:hypothetical protein
MFLTRRFTPALVGVITLLGVFVFSSWLRAEERISLRTSGLNTLEWRIDEPNVGRPVTEYPNIRFQWGDRVTVQAGGCNQTGGVGDTWKRYVDPQGDGSDRLYHGLIQIPGATQGLVRIASVVGRTLTVAPGIDTAQMYLRLGYEDDNYGDNGYSDRDPGTNNQCVGQPNAFVVLTIERANEFLTGVWSADDGGLYYLRQQGNDCWWAGLSNESGLGVNDFQRGLRFTNVFRGRIAGNLIDGTWADVPRGAAGQDGRLTLDIVSGSELRKRGQTVRFGASRWFRLVSLPSEPDIVERFNRVKRNDRPGWFTGLFTGNTMHDHLKVYKDNVVLFGTVKNPLSFFGTVKNPLSVNFPANVSRAYADFMCPSWWHGDGDPPDGDVTFQVHIDRAKLDAQPGFWTDGWLNNNPNDIRAKLDDPVNGMPNNEMHAELIMFGRPTDDCDGNVPPLLPGWMEMGANSVLVNGRPISGNLKIGACGDITHDSNSSCTVNQIAGQEFRGDVKVRVTGFLALDCHDFGGNCYEGDPHKQNVEIHPVYSVDIVSHFDRRVSWQDLTGIWAAPDQGTYYVRQVGNAVWWLGLSRDRGRTFAQVFQGTIQGDALRGEWVDVPLGTNLYRGVHDIPLGASGSTSIRLVARDGGFFWEKLYDIPPLLQRGFGGPTRGSGPR